MKIFCIASTMAILLPHWDSFKFHSWICSWVKCTPIPYNHSACSTFRKGSIYCLLEWQREGHIQRESEYFWGGFLIENNDILHWYKKALSAWESFFSTVKDFKYNSFFSYRYKSTSRRWTQNLRWLLKHRFKTQMSQYPNNRNDCIKHTHLRKDWFPPLFLK